MEPLPQDQALETVVADIRRIDEARDQHELLELRIQEAAGNVQRLFGYTDICDIEDDGTVEPDLLALKAAVIRLADEDQRLWEFTRPEEEA